MQKLYQDNQLQTTQLHELKAELNIVQTQYVQLQSLTAGLVRLEAKAQQPSMLTAQSRL